MAKPTILQKLKNGLMLCKHNFPTFTDTWNWMVSRVDNLKGDADVQGQMGKGLITVDNTDSEHPVIRFIGDGRFESCKGDADISASGQGFYNTKSIKTIDAYQYDADLSGNAQIKVYQLNNFGLGNKVSPKLSSDDVLVRRNISGNYNLEYVSLSQISGGVGTQTHGDADLFEDTNASIQTVEIDGSCVLQLYKFDEFENEEPVCDKVILPYDYEHKLGVAIRDNNNGENGNFEHKLQYVDLRHMFPYADSEQQFHSDCAEPFTEISCRSIDKNAEEYEQFGLNVFQLHDFPDACATTDFNMNHQDVLVRDYSGEMELKYIPVSSFTPFIPDSECEGACKSLEKHETGVASLYHFSELSCSEIPQDRSDTAVLCRRLDGDSNTLEYYPLSSVMKTDISADSSIESCTKSIDIDDGLIRLHNFNHTVADGWSTLDLSSNSKSAKDETSGIDTQFLTKENGELKYTKLQFRNGVCFKGNSCDASAPEYQTGMKWNFESMSDSNIKIEVYGNTIKIGAYYL